MIFDRSITGPSLSLSFPFVAWLDARKKEKKKKKKRRKKGLLPRDESANYDDDNRSDNEFDSFSFLM